MIFFNNCVESKNKAQEIGVTLRVRLPVWSVWLVKGVKAEDAGDCGRVYELRFRAAGVTREAATVSWGLTSSGSGRRWTRTSSPRWRKSWTPATSACWWDHTASPRSLNPKCRRARMNRSESRSGRKLLMGPSLGAVTPDFSEWTWSLNKTGLQYLLLYSFIIICL